jgi:hypothetical protein
VTGDVMDGLTTNHHPPSLPSGNLELPVSAPAGADTHTVPSLPPYQSTLSEAEQLIVDAAGGRQTRWANRVALYLSRWDWPLAQSEIAPQDAAYLIVGEVAALESAITRRSGKKWRAEVRGELEELLSTLHQHCTVRDLPDPLSWIDTSNYYSHTVWVITDAAWRCAPRDAKVHEIAELVEMLNSFQDRIPYETPMEYRPHHLLRAVASDCFLKAAGPVNVPGFGAKRKAAKQKPAEDLARQVFGLIAVADQLWQQLSSPAPADLVEDYEVRSLEVYLMLGMSWVPHLSADRAALMTVSRTPVFGVSQPALGRQTAPWWD